MRRFRSPCLAAASALIWICGVDAARPRYGGTLRVETAAAMRSLNPAAAPLDAADALARRWLHRLIFETLVAPDVNGGLKPMLAVHWESNPDASQWRFHLRSGVKLHDGSPLDAGRVAAALQAHAREWTVTSDLGAILIDARHSRPELPWHLTDVRYAVAFGRPGGGEPIGTGPFAIDRWEPKRLRLRAHEEHWAGRPFLDAVQIEMGRAVADQLSSIALGRADLIALQPQAVQTASQRGLRIAATRPLELIAVVFDSGSGDIPLSVRRALSLAVDRPTMCRVLLQGYAQPASGLLPDWLSGYAALLASDYDRAAARAAVASLPPADRRLMLRLQSTDDLVRTVADRVAVDAREVGLSVTVAPAGSPTARQRDGRLVRVRLVPATRELALAGASEALGLRPRPAIEGAQGGATPIESAFRMEVDSLESGAVVPLVHVSELYATASSVDSWLQPVVLPTGAWNLENVWLRVVGR